MWRAKSLKKQPKTEVFLRVESATVWKRSSVRNIGSIARMNREPMRSIDAAGTGYDMTVSRRG
jgi:hypothetical protein